MLAELSESYAGRGIVLSEVAGGWMFRTNAGYAPFVRELTTQRPVRLTRAQVETLAIVAYRQPVTRPEVDDIRGVDCGATLKLLLERDLARILGKRDEPGRPLLYGTTSAIPLLFRAEIAARFTDPARVHRAQRRFPARGRRRARRSPAGAGIAGRHDRSPADAGGDLRNRRARPRCR